VIAEHYDAGQGRAAGTLDRPEVEQSIARVRPGKAPLEAA